MFHLACNEFAAAPAEVAQATEKVVELLSVDSTVVRAHQHAAGARKSTDVEVVSMPSEHTGGTIESQEFGDRAR